MFEELKTILVRQFKVPAEQVTPDAGPDDLELDSLTMVELSMSLQAELGLEISEDELLGVKTVGEIVALMDERSMAGR